MLRVFHTVFEWDFFLILVYDCIAFSIAIWITRLSGNFVPLSGMIGERPESNSLDYVTYKV